jgi:ketosteroid isomerase-like protein
LHPFLLAAKEETMAIEANKDLVKRTWQTLLGGNVEEALANFSDDVTWFLTGTLEGVSGLKQGKQAVRAFLGTVRQAFPGGLKPEIKKAYGEGDTVVIELVNRGTSATGKSYENEYCFVFDLAGGKIQAIREYVDLEKAKVALAP